ncbi:MAG: BLUF domain-containing protein [Alphaproteobacteria bacterium]|nr:BLUF domain-containing protein [Alphaproteobacteria bacterium]MBU1526425.1 BLUF domain-containing protein [Alphaproteobacteria bacterium]MBU2118004.1 BLUF domain-containing protein [Alphaproteobacteria bacterium]MBU2352254.1 BLUF domain-containing protein [Alphaproteobacteria bacterium]MBU2383638.1 BLUF domain-containing protein [Alphaproteobacteria bacterium]
MAGLRQIVYLSRAAGPMDRLQDIAEILGASRQNNWRDGVTGALVFADGRFLQVVEGRPETVERLLARVSADPRHLGVEVVLRREIAARDFADWSMAMPRVDPEVEPLMREAVATAATDPVAAVALLRRLAGTAP